MMTVLEALKSKVKYPLSDDLFGSIMIERNLEADHEYTLDVSQSTAFRGARADCYKELLDAPNIGESGVSITLSDRELIANVANALYAEIGEPPYGQKSQPKITVLNW